MKDKKLFITENSEKIPEWYWPLGLHDACIYDIECYEYPEVYYKCKGKNKDNIYNLLILKIDSVGAVYDQTVKEIRFYNYKYADNSIDFKDLIGHKKIWWMGDTFTERESRYILDIDFYDCEAYPKEFNIKFSFEIAETDRK